MRARALILLLLALLPACAPGYAPPGPHMNAPAFETDALLTADGLRLPLRVWRAQGPTRAAVLALHGFNDYSLAFEGPARSWAADGVTTYAYDQRGFGDAPNRGRWPGMAAFADDATAALAEVRRRHPGVPVYLLGESMGGAIAMVTMTMPHPPPVAGVILVAPAVWGRQTMDVFKRVALTVISGTMPWFTVSGRGLGIRASDNDEMLRAFSRDPLVIKDTRADTVKGLVDLMDAALASAPRFTPPALILYGEKDEIVPQEPTALMLDRLPDRSGARQRIAVYPQGWHMLLRDLQAETVWRDIRAWIADPAAPLPSGADKGARERLPDRRKS
ncbi:MAG: lysophospholipase [Alphaproteobacteria bacterium]